MEITKSQTYSNSLIDIMHCFNFVIYMQFQIIQTIKHLDKKGNSFVVVHTIYVTILQYSITHTAVLVNKCKGKNRKNSNLIQLHTVLLHHFTWV